MFCHGAVWGYTGVGHEPAHEQAQARQHEQEGDPQPHEQGCARVFGRGGGQSFDAESGELVLTHLHPGVSPEAAIEATSWLLKVADELIETEEPTERELDVLRSLVPSEESNVAELIPSIADLE